MKNILFLLCFCTSFTCFAQDYSRIGKKIVYSDSLKQAKKFTSVDKALEDPGKVLYLEIYCQKSGVNIKKFSENIQKFKNLRKLTVNNQSGSVVELPEELWNLTQLEYIDIINIQNLKPEGLKNLKNVKYLSLDGFGLERFPPEILELKKIEYLNLSCNFLSELPENISLLENLKEIELTSNCFTKIPPQLAKNKLLIYIVMNNAEWGTLANGKPMCRNSITEFPVVFSELKNLKWVACFYKTNVDEQMKKKIKAAYPGIKFS